MNQATQILFDLVSTASPSGSERAAAETFVRHAAHIGCAAEIDEAGNALAHRGRADAPVHIVLLGHIDTVPGDILVRIEDNILHGRGSVDAKGPLAAMLVAAAHAELPEGVRLTVAGAVGEETPRSPGARHLAAALRPSACIIGEPSAWTGVTLGYKGRLLAHATSNRNAAHSAGPDNSACDDLHHWWAAIERNTADFNTTRTRQFDRLQSTIHSMSSATDGLTQSATLRLGFRLPPSLDPGALESELRAAASPSIHLSCEGAEQAVVVTRNDPVARALSTAIRAAGATPTPKLKTGTSDMNVVAPIWQCPIAAYGPGDSALDHTPTECLSLVEYERSIGVLGEAIRMLAEELLEVGKVQVTSGGLPHGHDR